MRHIYSSATSVVAWFGFGLADIEHLFDTTMLRDQLFSKFCQKLSNEELQTLFDRGNERRFDWEHILFPCLRLRDSDVTLDQFRDTLCEYFRVLFDQPWFKRIWTMQEALLAKELVLKAGRAFTTWNRVVGILDILVSSLTSRGPQTKDLGSMATGWLALFLLRRETYPNSDCDGEFSWIRFIPHIGRKASDDRDYVYGQLGLANAKIMDYLKPDYSAKVESVFMDYTIAILETDRNLRVLETCCAAIRDPKYDVPSWCRDWSGTFLGCPLTIIYKDDLYNAATLCGPPTAYRISRDVLCVRGVIIDEISVRYTGFMANDAFDMLRAWHMIWQAFLPSDGCSNEKERQEALCRTIINDRLSFADRSSSVAISQAVAWLLDLGIEIKRCRRIHTRRHNGWAHSWIYDFSDQAHR